MLDPPLHEFLPHDAKAQKEMAEQLGIKPAEVKARAEQLHEANPMLGHRGCRLSVTYPEILEMQVRAIVEAAINCAKKKIDAQPEIMIPLVGTAAELELLREQVEETIEETKTGQEVRRQSWTILIGTMIEIPRAALTADEIAKHADFFSFGTNDLTQMTFGYSRDDVNTFLPDYLAPGDPPCRSVPIARHHGRRAIGRDGRRQRPQDKKELKVRYLRRTRRRSRVDPRSATRSAWTTSAAAPSECRSPGWPQPKSRSANRSATCNPARSAATRPASSEQ